MDFVFATPALRSGSRVDVVFTNDATSAGQDRNLYVHLLSDGRSTVLPTLPGAVIDRGTGAKAFDGQDLVPGQGSIYWSGALRLTWPAPAVTDPALRARRAEAARFLLQASFGPTPAEIDALAASTPAQWIDRQMAIRHRADFVDHVQARFALGDDHRPGGGKYTDAWIGERFWALAATAKDQLRQRVGFALHHVFMASQADSNLWKHSRAYARYLDTLNKHAFGNFRGLLDEIALSPVMGIYLSHMRNRKEDPATGRLPDENFAREVMQLFTIGLHELNADGTPRLDARPAHRDLRQRRRDGAGQGLHRLVLGLSRQPAHRQPLPLGQPRLQRRRRHRIDLKKMKRLPGPAFAPRWCCLPASRRPW
jgi:hypothetical protein